MHTPDESNDALYIPLNILLIIAIAGVHWGINGLMMCGVILAPIALTLVLCMFIEAGYGIQPLAIIWQFASKAFSYMLGMVNQKKMKFSFSKQPL
jgi:hypothetical protein